MTLVFVVLGISVFLLTCLHQRDELLTYQGQTFDYWFAQLPPTMIKEGGMIIKMKSMSHMGQQYGDVHEASLAFTALDSFGNAAMPYLMNKYLGSDSAIEQTARNVAKKAKMKSFPSRLAAIEHYQAVTALAYIEKLPDETVSRLTSLSKDPNSRYAESAKYILKDPNSVYAGFAE